MDDGSSQLRYEARQRYLKDPIFRDRIQCVRTLFLDWNWSPGVIEEALYILSGEADQERSRARWVGDDRD